MAELKALSKLKMAGKLHYWRGTIEIDERELNEICDEIQAEYDKAFDCGRDGPLEICRYFEPNCPYFEPKEGE